MWHRRRAERGPGRPRAAGRRRAVRRGDGPPRPRRLRIPHRRSDGAGAPAPGHRRPVRGRPPADDERGRQRRHRRQRRDLQPPGAARRPASPRGTASAAAATPRWWRTSTKRSARARPSCCAGCSRWRCGTRRERRLLLARDRVGEKPLYYAQRPDALRVRVRAGGAAGRPAHAGDAVVRGAGCLPGAAIRPRARPPSSRRSTSCRPATR